MTLLYVKNVHCDFSLLAAVKEKIILILVKTVRQTLFRTVAIGVGTTATGFCSRGERLGSTPNITRKSGALETGTVGGSKGRGRWMENC